MSDGMNGPEFFNALVGSDRRAEVSKDGKAINVTGEIASGINGTFSVRPSRSKGTGVDFNVDAGGFRHIEGD